MDNRASADEFLRLAEESGVVEREQLDHALKSLTDRGVELRDASTLANSLVSSHTLTRWQAEKLLEGKHQGFLLGKYRLLSLLGKGSMGTVYLADHTMMNRRVALKVLPFNHIEQPAFLDRFLREAQASAALDHPNIVRAYDVGKENDGKRDVYFLAMEYIEGRDLAELVKQEGALDFVRCADFVRQIAEGLAHAHDKGLVHRDVKPGNLLVDAQDVVRVLDLGLAVFHSTDQDEAASLTVTNNDHLLGTADYISPEQALNSHEVDHRTDIYSLGCTFYFLLTGQPPFRNGTVSQRLLAHQSQDPPPITNRRADCPESLSQIVMRMLAKSSDDRFASCHDVAATLQQWLDQCFPLSGDDTDHAVSVLEGPSSSRGAGDTQTGATPFEDEETSLPATGRSTTQFVLQDDSKSRSWTAPIAAASVVLLALAAFWIAQAGGDADKPTPPTKDGESAETTPDTSTGTQPTAPDSRESVAGEKPGSPVEPESESQPAATTEPTPLEQWQSVSQKMKADSATMLYLSFETRPADGEPIANEAQTEPFEELTLQPKVLCEWVPGRWEGTSALRFGGTQDGQFLALGGKDSALFNLADSFTVFAWIRVSKFSTRYQTIISKGDHGFRLARFAQSSGMAFAINRWAAPQAPRDYPVMTEVGNRDYSVGDGTWHFVTGVVDTEAEKVEVSLYVDGVLRGRKPSEASLAPNDQPVLIGGNSFFLFDRKRKNQEGVEWARQFAGDIDEIAILARAMTADEISKLFETGMPPVGEPASSKD